MFPELVKSYATQGLAIFSGVLSPQHTGQTYNPSPKPIKWVFTI